MPRHLVIGLIALFLLFAGVAWAALCLARTGRPREGATDDGMAGVAGVIAASSIDTSAASVDCASSAAHC